MRRNVAVLAACTFVCLVLVWVPAHFARADSGDAEKAAQEITAARDRADAAALALSDAESRYALLLDEEKATQAELDDLSKREDELRASVQQMAIDQFVLGSTAGIPIVSGLTGPSQQAQADVFMAIATDSSASRLDEFDALQKQAEGKRVELRTAQADTQTAQVGLRAAEQAARDEVVRVKEVEDVRLKDVAVRQALERQDAEKRRLAAAESQRQASEAASTTTSSVAPGAVVDIGSEGDVGAGPDVTSGFGGTREGNSGSAPPTTPPPTLPLLLPLLPVASSEGDVTAAIPVPTGPDVFGGVGWVCPVAGNNAFADTWGAPRSGGRRHEGVDMIAPEGTPLVAVVDGTAKNGHNTLGGDVAWVYGNDGNRYYYAHLSAFAKTGPVKAGDVVGYVGHTGDTFVDHLHFEIHPDGGPAVNPTPTVAAFC